MNNTCIQAEFVHSLYKQREKLIIFGLTGRTGAGCSKVADILSKPSIDELDLRSYKTCDYSNADERKYSVIYRFMKEGGHWHRFYVIEASAIIFSFILEHSLDELFDYINQMVKKGHIKDINKLKEEIKRTLQIDDETKEIDGYLKKILNYIADDTINKKEVKEIKEIKEWVIYLTEGLKGKKKDFSDVLKNYTFKWNRNESNDIDKDKNESEEISNLYTLFMQEIANNIRASGECYNSEARPEMETTIVNRINKIISLINEYEEKVHVGSEHTRICIDALRSPVELQFFRDRYRAFYAVAVNTEEENRKIRLDLSSKVLESLDKIEYKGDDKVFYKQNVQACLQIADIYIYNPQVYDNKYFELTEQLIKYIALILKPGLVAPTHIERCMQLAFNAKYNSGCLSRQVGAVVTGEDFSVRSIGWNDVPKGQVPCNLRCVEDYCRNKDPETFSVYELDDPEFDKRMTELNTLLSSENVRNAKKGNYFSYCFKDIYNDIKGTYGNQVHTRSLHAEENAFLQIAKYGGAEIRGGKLFSTASPCELCSKKAYQLGIKEIYYIDLYPGISLRHILKFGKTGNPAMILFQGAIGNAYISLYSPIMPHKDEMSLITGLDFKKNENEENKCDIEDELNPSEKHT